MGFIQVPVLIVEGQAGPLIVGTNVLKPLKSNDFMVSSVLWVNLMLQASRTAIMSFVQPGELER